MGQGALNDPKIVAVLDRLERAARGDIPRIIRGLPNVAKAIAKGGTKAIGPALYRESYIPISPEQGRFLYLTARAIGARNIVEFGTSYGISTIYLAAAARDNGGRVIGSELEEHKWLAAKENLRAAGLSGCSEIRLGDALKTLADVGETVDFVLLDGWKELYLPVLELLAPKLRKGSVVVADDIFRFRSALAPYVALMQSGRNGFVSTSLRMAGGLEYSVYQG
jgi:predicted O-methyltransferase YrrM